MHVDEPFTFVWHTPANLIKRKQAQEFEMNVLVTAAEAWVAANQFSVMATLVAAFVAFHLFLLAKAAFAD